jgi:hypothetical protein
MRRRVPGYPFGPDAALVAHHLPERLATARSIVFVEGVSDRIAVETLAARRGLDLDAADVVVVAIGGAQGLRRALRAAASDRAGVILSGLYDEAEEEVVRAALVTAGALREDEGPEDAGFWACRRDLEEELIRACGVPAIERRLEQEGDLARFRRMQRQPEWRGRPPEQQLHRWIGNRKLQYARALVEVADMDRMPSALVSVVERATQA